MLLRNKSAKLIVINGKISNGNHQESYKILCGDNPAIEVPDVLCNSHSVKEMIRLGQLEVIKKEAPKRAKRESNEYKAEEKPAC